MSNAAPDRIAWTETGRGRAAGHAQHHSGLCPDALNELIHEIRQPLGVIEALAYYLELTLSDEAASAHAKRIQAMVSQVSHILERASDFEDKYVAEPVSC
jgi:nitrogen-specific signal transduction histidine kinase